MIKKIIMFLVMFILTLSFSLAIDTTYLYYDFSNPTDYCLIAQNLGSNVDCDKFPTTLLIDSSLGNNFVLPYNINNVTSFDKLSYNIQLNEYRGTNHLVYRPFDDCVNNACGSIGSYYSDLYLYGDNNSIIVDSNSPTVSQVNYNATKKHVLTIVYTTTNASYYIDGVLMQNENRGGGIGVQSRFKGSSIYLGGSLLIYKMSIQEGIHINEFPYSTNSSLFNLTCDTQSCLFYDDFHLNTSVSGYSGYTNTTNVVNNTLFFDSSVEDSTIIEHNFLQTDTYKKIVYYLSFDTNYKTLPQALNFSNNDRETFSTWLKCSDGTYPFNINFDVFSWATYTGNYDYTTFALYDSSYKTLAMFDIKNDDIIVYKFIIDKENNKLSISSKRSDNPYDANLYMFSDIPDVASINIPECNIYTGIALMRRDAYYSNSTYNVGINKILVSGYDFTSNENNGMVFLYTNATTNANATIKTDVAENLQNLAFNFGFKTTASKLLIWFIVLLAILGFIMFSNINATAKSFLAVGFGVGGFVVGWYLGFIPTALLVFLIFAFAILGALIIKNMMSGGN